MKEQYYYFGRECLSQSSVLLQIWVSCLIFFYIFSFIPNTLRILVIFGTVVDATIKQFSWLLNAWFEIIATSSAALKDLSENLSRARLGS